MNHFKIKKKATHLAQMSGTNKKQKDELENHYYDELTKEHRKVPYNRQKMKKQYDDENELY